MMTRVVTMGAADQDWWVTSFTVSTKIDSENSYTEVGQTFVGNFDRRTRVFSNFPIPVQARFVQLHPVTWVTRLAMRMAVVAAPCSAELLQLD